MRASTSTIRSILAGGLYQVAECYDITLATGQAYHFTSWDVPLSGVSVITKAGTTGPFNYLTGLTIVRGKITQKSGVQAGEMEVVLAPQSDNPSGAPTIAGYPVWQAARYGFLRGAQVQLNRLYMNPAFPNATAVGWFLGTVQELNVDRLAVHMTVNDFLAYLGNQQMPRILWGAGCFHEVYDAGCTLLKANFTVSGTLTSVGDAAHFTASAMTQPTGYFNLGVLEFTSGVNNGVQGPVNVFTNPGAIGMRFPFPKAPAVGDTFTVYPGCDKQQATCSNTNSATGPAFNNLTHFSGQPYIPDPSTIMDGGSSSVPAQTRGAQAGQLIGSAPAGRGSYYNPAAPYKY